MSASPKLRLAIVGGGIGGLTLAVALSHLRLDEFLHVDIYESAVKLTQVGAGIGVFPRAWEVLKDLGMAADLEARMAPSPLGIPKPKLAFSFRKSDERNGFPFFDLIIPGEYATYHRADLQEILLNHISSFVQCHLNHRLVNYNESKEEIELEFKNGETASCDILVGADGINSVVRKVFLARIHGLDSSSEEAATNSAPVWSGTSVYRGLVDSELIKRELPNHSALTTPLMYCGKNKHIVTYPVSQGRLINIVPFVSELEKEGSALRGPAIEEANLQDFVHLFAGWEDEVQCLIKNMNKVSRWAVQTVKPLDTHATERVILLGDAAHAMTPHLGSGAGQAIEDAYVFANLLDKLLRQGSRDIRRASNAYTAIRRPIARSFVVGSRDQGIRYEFNAPGFEDIQEGDAVPPERLRKLGKSIEEGWELPWKHSVRDDLQRALDIL